MTSVDDDYVGFVTKHADRLYRAAWMLTYNQSDAEDLVHDVLVRLYGSWAKVMESGHPLAYVRRSMVNMFLNQRRRGELSIGYVDLPSIADPLDQYDEVLDRIVLVEWLSRMRSRVRVAIVLRYFEHLTDDEIAVMLGCRPATVRSLISRGLRDIRARIDDIAPIAAHGTDSYDVK